MGDWHFSVWREGLDEPLFRSPLKGSLLGSGKQEDSVRLLCGAWSPTRPAVLLLGREDGQLDVWDLLDRSHEPSETAEVAVPRALTTLAFHPSVGPGGQGRALAATLAVGDGEGTLHVLVLPGNYVSWGARTEAREKEAMAAFWGREAARLRSSERVEAAAAGTARVAAGDDAETDPDEAPAPVVRRRRPEDDEGPFAYSKEARDRYRELEDKYRDMLGVREEESSSTVGAGAAVGREGKGDEVRDEGTA